MPPVYRAQTVSYGRLMPICLWGSRSLTCSRCKIEFSTRPAYSLAIGAFETPSREALAHSCDQYRVRHKAPETLARLDELKHIIEDTNVMRSRHSRDSARLLIVLSGVGISGNL